MKQKVIIAVALVIVTVFSVSTVMRAQMSPQDKAQRFTEKMTKKLDLKEDQIPLVYELNLAKVESRHKKYDTKEAKKQARQATRKAWKEGLKKVLTATQFEKINRRK